MNIIYDIGIIGGGPAGLTAAIYGLRNGKSVITIEKSVFGGQIVNSPCVENIPGFKKISGDKFGDLLLDQVSELGGEFIFDECIKVDRNDLITLHFKDNDSVFVRTLIVATGSEHKRLNIENEEALIGKHVHFCATCDGLTYKNKHVCLVGGGNSALLEGNLLASNCRKLIILQNLDHFTGEKRMIDKLLSYPNVEVNFNVSDINYLIEDNIFKGITYKQDGVSKTSLCDGVFLSIGLVPNNKMFEGFLDLDDNGYLISDESLKTKYDNIFVAGDCRHKIFRQVIGACSDGGQAASLACLYLEGK